MLNSPETVTRLQPHFQVDWLVSRIAVSEIHDLILRELRAGPDKGGTVGSVLSPGHLRVSNVFVSPHIHEPKIEHFFTRLGKNRQLKKLTRRQRQGKRHFELEFALFQTDFIATILPCTICQMWAIFQEIILNDFIQDQKQEKENRRLAFTSSITRVIRKFQVVVVQGRQRNVQQKSVMHMQSCCFANLNLLLFAVVFLLPSPSSWMLKLPYNKRK